MADNDPKNTNTAPPAAPPPAPEATLAELQDALRKGANVKVQMPEGVSSVTLEGVMHEIDEEENTVMVHVRHAVHLVEAFGGRILSALKPKAAITKK
jgi:hypothetical protein